METNTAELTYAQHASIARGLAKAAGLADCIHYAPSWGRRVDALYDVLHGLKVVPRNVGLLPDGRMVVVGTTSSAFEPLPVR